MKKLIALFVVAAVFAACNNATESASADVDTATVVTVDTPAVMIDSAAAAVVDSAKARAADVKK